MDEWPDWKDVGRRVRLVFDNGAEVVGILQADEFFTGEDEVPVFSVKTDDGKISSFADAKTWEFI